MNNVNEEGDPRTRELVDRLREDRAVALRENRSLQDENLSLHGRNATLQDNVTDMHRSGLSPGAYRVVGLGVMALVLLAALTGLTLWAAGIGPVSRMLRGGGTAEGAPVAMSAAPVAPGQTPTFTATGPPDLIVAILREFKVMPTAIDTGTGTQLTVRYVDGPYSRLEGEAQRARALAVARFVWRLPQRPKATGVIVVHVERAMHNPGDVGKASDHIFQPSDLNGGSGPPDNASP